MISAILLVSAIVVLARKKVRRLFTAFGSAAWASNAELQGAGMIGATKGLILGRIKREGAPLACAVKSLLNTRLGAKDACREFFANLSWRKRKQSQLVRLPQAVHTMVVAPTGVGKGVSCIVPFLLTCEESCVVVDFKGENALLTAQQRRRMGHKIVTLDPFMVATKKLRRPADTFNPFDFIPLNEQALDECRDLAEALVICGIGTNESPHWPDSAEAVISSVAATVVLYGRKDKGTRSLQDARDILPTLRSSRSPRS